MEQNIAATDIVLTEGNLNRLEEIIPLGTDTDNRYDEQMMKGVNL